MSSALRGGALRRPLGGQARGLRAHGGDSAATSALVATDTSLWWFDGYCRIGKMYKAKAVYVQAHCGGKGDVPVTLDAAGRPHAGDLGPRQDRGVAAVPVSGPTIVPWMDR